MINYNLFILYIINLNLHTKVILNTSRLLVMWCDFFAPWPVRADSVFQEAIRTVVTSKNRQWLVCVSLVPPEFWLFCSVLWQFVPELTGYSEYSTALMRPEERRCHRCSTTLTLDCCCAVNFCVCVLEREGGKDVCDVWVTANAAKDEPASPPVDSQLGRNFHWRADEGRPGRARLTVAGESLSLSLSSHTQLSLSAHLSVSLLFLPFIDSFSFTTVILSLVTDLLRFFIQNFAKKNVLQTLIWSVKSYLIGMGDKIECE